MCCCSVASCLTRKYIYVSCADLCEFKQDIRDERTLDHIDLDFCIQAGGYKTATTHLGNVLVDHQSSLAEAGIA
jgi:hypothetical protein